MTDNENKEINLHSQTFKNRDILQEANDCVCVNCSEEFKVEEISDWLDNKQTAVCPHCHVDAVLPKTETLTTEKLKELHYLWFTPIFYTNKDEDISTESNPTE